MKKHLVTGCRIITIQLLIGGTELENSFEKSCFWIRLQETICHNSFRVALKKAVRSRSFS